MRALRSDANLNRTLVAAMTGYDDDGYKERTRAAGFDAHLVKSFGVERVEELINRLSH